MYESFSYYQFIKLHSQKKTRAIPFCDDLEIRDGHACIKELTFTKNTHGFKDSPWVWRWLNEPTIMINFNIIFPMHYLLYVNCKWVLLHNREFYKKAHDLSLYVLLLCAIVPLDILFLLYFLCVLSSPIDRIFLTEWLSDEYMWRN